MCFSDWRRGTASLAEKETTPALISCCTTAFSSSAESCFLNMAATVESKVFLFLGRKAGVCLRSNSVAWSALSGAGMSLNFSFGERNFREYEIDELIQKLEFNDRDLVRSALSAVPQRQIAKKHGMSLTDVNRRIQSSIRKLTSEAQP